MDKPAQIGAEYSEEIRAAAERFGDHEGMSPARVLKWMLQFSEEDLPLAEKLLQQLRYFNANNLRALTRQMVEMIMNEVDGATPGGTVFVPLSREPGGGAEIVARVLRSLRNPVRPRIMTMVDLGEPPSNVDTLVFVDDFSGTGDTLTEWWETIEALVRPLAARAVFAALIMTSGAAERVSEFAVAASVLELGPDSNVLGDDNAVFDGSEKERIFAYCRDTGCDAALLRGYGECGLLLAFTHGCPNNSLPILWYGDKGWDTLFLRRAI